MATRKTAAPKTDALNLTKRGAEKALAKLPRKNAITLLAEQTVKNNQARKAAAKKPRKTTAEVSASLAKKARAISVSPLGATKIKTETRSAAAKRADPAPTVKLAFAQHEVKNIGQLARILDTTYGANCTWQSEFHFGVNYLNVLNIRGRKVAEIKLVPKK